VCHGSARLIWALAEHGLRVATLATVGSGRGWLGAVVARHAAGRNWRCASNGAFPTSLHVDWGLSQRPVRINCGLSYTTVQARSVIVACVLL